MYNPSAMEFNSIVAVPIEKYEELARDSEKLETIKRILRRNEYITNGELRAILDIEEVKESEDCENAGV